MGLMVFDFRTQSSYSLVVREAGGTKVKFLGLSGDYITTKRLKVTYSTTRYSLHEFRMSM